MCRWQQGVVKAVFILFCRRLRRAAPPVLSVLEGPPSQVVFIGPLAAGDLLFVRLVLRCFRWEEADGSLVLYLHFHWAVGLLLLHAWQSPLVLLFDDLGLIELVLPGNIAHDIMSVWP